MSTITIIIENQTNTDYDGVNETLKVLSANIDGVNLPEIDTREDTMSDADCKTAYKSLLTSIGYTWDNEL